MPDAEEWILALGLRPVSDDPNDSAIPDAVLNGPSLSLTAKALYALVLSTQGRPLNPFEDAFEDSKDIHAAIDELVAAGLVVRTTKQ
ncbi:MULTISPECIES: hypothetical protein [Microbacterium]|uniref:Uncharacterized protein n=1 Tax=Microbacterium aerolatum TaxID=153731 RepID=A0A511AEM3_9MICO|nr:MULTISPECIES: hypothetical protein [Microbacterium]GEK86615.1 hypothetical protein MAE01_17910 [Microbacterium aerolatum]GGB18337.1 hypothetical protein GCM10007198_06090 [Microbacterium aerolatum]